MQNIFSSGIYIFGKQCYNLHIEVFSYAGQRIFYESKSEVTPARHAARLDMEQAAAVRSAGSGNGDTRAAVQRI